MSAPKRPSDDQDPDYASPEPPNAKQQKIYEDTARAHTANQIVTIVEKEFTKEIDQKEKEVLEIQSRLQKALKTLHLLRYVVVTDFYNRKQCQAPQAAVESNQSQIHPAIKRLIGKTPRRQRVGLADPGPSTSNSYENEVQASPDVSEIKKRLGLDLEIKSEKRISPEKSNAEVKTDSDPPKKIPRYIPPKSNTPAVTSPARGVRHKVWKRIVIGNISKWIPPDWREDGASHKWMMYVRGSKEAPDITDFVSKVRFFLHPSYQPNDVVQVTSPPFHLSRRGWGEFPLRVQLHFKNALNKPMDVIHYLKLDRTYTGLQTLGSETVVNIWIHTTNPQNFKKSLDTVLDCEDDPSKRNDAKVVRENSEINLSIVKEEFQPTDSLNNVSSVFERSVKVERTESQVVNENCIKIEHNYVSSMLKEDDHVDVVNCIENNVTIRHSTNDKCHTIDRSSKNAGNLINNNVNCDLLKLDENNAESVEKIEDNEQCDDNIRQDTTSNGQCVVETSVCESLVTTKTDEGVHVSENTSKTKEIVESKQKNFSNNVETNGIVSPIPIKLVKCNDKFFFMTDVGKLASNSVDLAKMSNANVVENILAKKIQPAKVALVRKASTELKRPITEAVELLNSQNGTEKNVSITASSRRSEYLTSGSELGMDSSAKLLKIDTQRLEMQRLASSLKCMPSKSKPLKITIPPLDEPQRKKQKLVLENSQYISIKTGNSSSLTAVVNPRQLSARSILYDKKSQDGIGKVSIFNKGVKTVERVSLLKPSISILKKSDGNNKLDMNNQSKPAIVLNINPSKSLLLNSNSTVPVLQIAKPLYNNLQIDKRNVIVPNRVGQVKLKQLPRTVKIDDQDDSKTVKVSVTLGKDKQKLLSKKEKYEDILRSIETVEIKDIIGALRYIMKRTPLITQEAKDPDYRQLHPYACCTQEEFLNYHLGKQRAHEWFRAKMVRSFLKKKGFQDNQLWSVKEILNWARIHGYTPVQTSLDVGNAAKTSKKIPEASNSIAVSTCTESLQFNKWLENCKDLNISNEDGDIEIDVVHITEPKTKMELKIKATGLTKDTITLDSDPLLELPSVFVDETAREIGVRLQREEIIPGVLHSAAERMMVEAMRCFVDDLMRRSHAKAWERSNNKFPDTIKLDDVRGALLTRDEFDVFTNEGLGSSQNMG
ncbi:YEATS domain-containing protein 2 [Neodiprion fabricii]|uniref:YEATS domain-containing protein 2 n=1 Tax=Neodiprion fabricii TaxID=2872261 RepID=UPI001ED942E0|nr:YEATS domain-containing protein 2 [Neodiprion fabricii]